MYLSAIGAVGFPIVMCLLMFFKLVPAIDGLKDAVVSLKTYMERNEG